MQSYSDLDQEFILIRSTQDKNLDLNSEAPSIK